MGGYETVGTGKGAEEAMRESVRALRGWGGYERDCVDFLGCSGGYERIL